jgi:uncharacterized FlaG/YvyC family protein
MEGLTFSASHQRGSPELPSVASAAHANRPTTPSAGEAAVQGQPAPDQNRAVAQVAHVEAQGSPFQARLNYDRDRASVVVEILDPETGDVIQRIPAETAAERIHELTGGYGGTVVDKIA